MAKRCHSVLLLATLLLLACSNNDIVVEVVDLPSLATRLEVRLQLNDREAKLLSIEPARDRFILNLPDEMEGRVSIQVVGIGSMGCWESEGTTEFDFLVGKHAPTYVRIEQRVTSLCPLEIQILGEGKVTSVNAPGVACFGGTCRYTLPSKSSLTLMAVPALTGYVTTWGGDCFGQVGDCTLNLSSTMTVKVDFSPTQCSSNQCWSKSGLPAGVKQFDALWVAPRGEAFAVEGTSVWLNKDGNWSPELKGETKDTYSAAWGTDAQHVFLVGANGMVMIKDGSWPDKPLSTGSTAKLLGVWGTDFSNVWVVGEQNTVVRRNGTLWESENPDPTYPTHTLRGIWGTDSNNIWAVGQGGVVLHKTAGKWSAQVIDDKVEFRAIWGRDAKHIWAVGDRPLSVGTGGRSGSVVYFFDGNIWSDQSPTSNKRLTAIWGTSARDVWAVGDRGAVFHYDGTNWQGIPWMLSLGSPDFIGISGSACNNVWAISSTGEVFRYQPG